MMARRETIENWTLLIGVRTGWTRTETLALPLRRLAKTVTLLTRK
jgi:hypothetical protein